MEDAASRVRPALSHESLSCQSTAEGTSMALVDCTNCGRRITAQAVPCPGCSVAMTRLGKSGLEAQAESPMQSNPFTRKLAF